MTSTRTQTSGSLATRVPGGVRRRLFDKLSDVVSVKDFGAKGDGVTDDTDAINAGIVATAASRKALFFPAGTYIATEVIQAIDNMTICGEGRGSRLQKNFTTTGSLALVAPLPNASSANNVTISDMEFGAVSYQINGVDTNKILMCTGSNWRVHNVAIKTWSGWAMTIGGNYHEYRGIYLEDPMPIDTVNMAGHDGVHVQFGGNILIDGVYGTASDDLIAILNPLGGVTSGQAINGVIVRNVFGQSNAGRVVALGAFASGNVGIHENIHLDGIYGRTLGQDHGTVLRVPGVQIGSLGSIVRNVSMKNFRIDASAAGQGLYMMGTTGFENMLFENGIFISGQWRDRAATVGASGMELRDGPVRNVTFRNVTVDATLGFRGIIGGNNTFENFRFSGNIQCGSSHGISVNTVEAFPGTRLNIDANINNIKNGNIAYISNWISDSVVSIRAKLATGQTVGTGISESTGSLRNVYTDCDISAMSTKVATPNATSRFVRVAGYVTASSGTATIASGATSVDVTHGLAVTPLAANIQITPTNGLGSAAKFWVSNITSTTFRINVNADPGVDTATFAWRHSNA